MHEDVHDDKLGLEEWIILTDYESDWLVYVCGACLVLAIRSGV